MSVRMREVGGKDDAERKRHEMSNNYFRWEEHHGSKRGGGTTQLSHAELRQRVPIEQLEGMVTAELKKKLSAIKERTGDKGMWIYDVNGMKDASKFYLEVKEQLGLHYHGMFDDPNTPQAPQYQQVLRYEKMVDELMEKKAQELHVKFSYNGFVQEDQIEPLESLKKKTSPEELKRRIPVEQLQAAVGELKGKLIDIKSASPKHGLFRRWEHDIEAMREANKLYYEIMKQVEYYFYDHKIVGPDYEPVYKCSEETVEMMTKKAKELHVGFDTSRGFNI